MAELRAQLEHGARPAAEILEDVEQRFELLAGEAGGEPLLALLLSLKNRLPLSPRVPSLLSRLHERCGHDAAAADAADEAQHLAIQARGGGERTLEEVLLLARLLLAADRAAEAHRLLKPLADKMQDNLQFMKLWAQIKHTQGQLTEAMRAFERVRALAPGDPSALLQLGIIHRLSQNPEAARRELELVGDHSIARRHLAQLELEKAYQFAARQQFTSAVEICDALAEKNRGVDRDVFKLAVLQKALLLEGLKNLDGEIETLEAFGRERGFETDVDRLRCLARAYELRARGDDLIRAQRVYEFLFQEKKQPEYLSRMARVAARRGDFAEAQKLDRRFTEAFRREHQELSLDELLRAAASHYVPLAQLRALAPDRAALENCARERAQDLSGGRRAKRELALLKAMLGEYEASADIWRELISAGDARPEDSKYFGEVCDAQGDAAGARAMYLAALSEEDVADAAVLNNVLSADDPDISRLMLAIFSDAEKRHRTYEALKHTAKSHQLSPEVWWTLARFERLIGLEPQAERHQAKAEALSRVAERSGPQIGHVKVAAVYDLFGWKQGIVHEIWASRYRVGTGGVSGPGGQLDESSIFGNVAPDMMRDIQNVFVAVKAFVVERFPHLVEDLNEYRYILKVTKDDERSGGNSAGIAVALCFLSVFLQKALPADIAVTGALVADSSSEISMARVADIEHKVLGVYERRMKLIVPSENRPDLEESHLVPREIWSKLVSFAGNLTQLMKIVFGDDLWEW